MRKIIWTKPAVSDLQAIVDYIAKDSKNYAHAFAEKILESVGNLSSFPLIGRFVPEYRKKEIREILFQSYRIIYRVESQKILIITIIHGSRNLEKKIRKL